MEQLIEYQQGTVLFPQYEEYLLLAHEVAAVLDSMPLTEDNIQEVKKSLADARKIVDALNARRIEVKKALLEPYNTLEAQVKMITGVIDEADAKLRVKVREMEEDQREQKKRALKNIWDQRAALYDFPSLIPNAFDLWLTPQHLNKSTPFSKAEQDMVNWMERVQREVVTICSMPDKLAILEEYAKTTDMAHAVSTVIARNERMAKLQQVEVGPSTATFIVTGDKDISLTEMLLKTNKINYRKV